MFTIVILGAKWTCNMSQYMKLCEQYNDCNLMNITWALSCWSFTYSNMSQIQITELLWCECLYSMSECRQLNDLDIVFLFPCSSMCIFKTLRRVKEMSERNMDVWEKKDEIQREWEKERERKFHRGKIFLSDFSQRQKYTYLKRYSVWM